MFKCNYKLLFEIVLGLLLILVSVTFSNASVLVVAPHPDDDIITSAGVINRAVERGEEVRVVYMTNGDYYGGASVGYLRQAEAVSGENVLGMSENNLIFLGYPDNYLSEIYTSDPNGELSTYNNNISKTYGNRGLGRMDYHSYRFGSPAEYNMVNMLMDLEDILSSFRPDQIIVTSEFDTHPDHSITYHFLSLALTSVHNANPGYFPVINKSVVHWDDLNWPSPIDPTSYIPVIPAISDTGYSWAQTGLFWSDRVSLDVPILLQSANIPTNPKYLALSAHVSQGGAAGYLSNFIHKDEIFWAENVLGNNHPPIVNAGSDLTVAEDAAVTLNGSQSKSPDSTPLFYQWVQRSGTPVVLVNPNSATPTFTAPTGLYQEDTLTFELVVSDGQFSSLPDSVNVTVTLQSSPLSNIAPLATVTASSERPQTGQAALKAVDGVVDGYPFDETREWVTNGQGEGAWLGLNWAVPYSVNRVVLYDRPNPDDNITNATITFSDGSSIDIGPLNNNGTATVFSFPAKVITGLTMTVTGVSDYTYEIGLAEIEVYGVLAGTTHYSLTTGVAPLGAGTVTVSPSKASYYKGEQVTLTARPNSGHTFVGWSGGACTTNPCSVTMDKDKDITAIFNLANIAKNITTSTPYTHLSTAVFTALSGAEIRTLDIHLDGAITLDKAIQLKGGWDTTFQNKSDSPTTLTGDLTVLNGDSTAEAVVVKGKLALRGGSLRVNGVIVGP
jgi:uncharacterized repeat protein (TIGR02543 family)